jgi:hypothetical protein
MTTMGDRIQAECSAQMGACLGVLQAVGATPGMATILADGRVVLLVQLDFRGPDDDTIETTTLDIFHCLGHALAGADALVVTVDVTTRRYHPEAATRPRDDPEATGAMMTMAIEYLADTHQLALRQFLTPYHRADDGEVIPQDVGFIDGATLAPHLVAAVAVGTSRGALPLEEVAERLYEHDQVVHLPSTGPDPHLN